jgi:hypothetical protein
MIYVQCLGVIITLFLEMLFFAEWFRSSEGTGSFPSPAASPQPFGGVSGAFGQSNFPMASGMVFFHMLSLVV